MDGRMDGWGCALVRIVDVRDGGRVRFTVGKWMAVVLVGVWILMVLI